MGWGDPPHEGYPDERRADGSFSGPTHRSGDPDAVAYVAACTCGWRCDREHPVPPRPQDEAQRSAWVAALEAADDACWRDWHDEHYTPLLGYDPSTALIEGRDEGGLRHFLNGRAVLAGAGLELLLADGHWVPVRYEWDFESGKPPRAYLLLGGPEQALRHDATPVVEFALAPRAVLRWPERDA